MRIVCAWCDRVLRESEDERISHGICPECKERVLREAEEWTDEKDEESKK